MHQTSAPASGARYRELKFADEPEYQPVAIEVASMPDATIVFHHLDGAPVERRPSPPADHTDRQHTKVMRPVRRTRSRESHRDRSRGRRTARSSSSDDDSGPSSEPPLGRHPRGLCSPNIARLLEAVAR